MEQEQNHARPLAGQTAWVTGSSRGIGRAIAECLAMQGAKVVIHGTREDSPSTFQEGETMPILAEQIAKASGSEVYPVWGDLTKEEEVVKIYREIEEKVGFVDLLICAAGGDIGAAGCDNGRGGRPENDDCLNISFSDIQSVMDRNLLTTILACKVAAPPMIKQKKGRIILIGSVAGTTGRAVGGIYAVAKAAVHEYTRCLADQLKEHNIPVNCIAPGPTLTQRFVNHLLPGMMDQKKKENVDKPTLDRYATAKDIADAVVLLCLPAAHFISGQVLRVDGGLQLFAC